MDREISFCGKTFQHNKFIYGPYTRYDDMHFIGIESEPTEMSIRPGVWRPTIVWYQVYPETVGMYTCRQDSSKSKIKLYEDDLFYIGGNKKVIYIIKYVEHGFHYQCIDRYNMNDNRWTLPLPFDNARREFHLFKVGNMNNMTKDKWLGLGISEDLQESWGLL